MCVFCEIARGSSHAAIVMEDESSVAFLDDRPLFPGHVLLIPRQHHETLANLPDHLIHPFFRNAQTLAKAVQRAVGAEGTFLAMNNKISQSVPHLHVHVVPRRPKDGLRGFFWPRMKYGTEEEKLQVAEAIRESVRDLR